MMLRGYRREDADLLTGDWLPGELLGLPLAARPPLVEPTSVEPPQDHSVELCIAPGAAFVRFSELDWVHRRARLEIGVQPHAAADVGLLLKSAVAHGFRVLNLRRIHGCVTPAVPAPVEVLLEAGFRHEATIPEAIWLAGAPVERQLWGAMRDE